MKNYELPIRALRKVNNQLFRVMKVTAFLLLIGCLHLSAASRSQTVTLRAENESLRKVFKSIEKQTGYGVVFSDKLISESKPITIDAKDMVLTHFLEQVLAPQSLTYDMYGNTILIRLATERAVSPGGKPSELNLGIGTPIQQRVIRGKVTDEAGNPLQSVTVTQKNTPHVVSTNDQGNYEIEAEGNTIVLVFTNVGYIDNEQAVGNRTTIDVVMAESVSDLDEVVVVGYGLQKKSTLTGAVASVQSEQLTVAPVGNVTNTLTGKLPGLVTKQSSGMPGSDMAALNIRGFGAPLIIVDGVEAKLENLDANQIESITILKDGAASIYGSRAGNGVVLVTTKRGVSQKPTITVNVATTMQGITNMAKTPSSGQLAQMQRESHLQSGQPEETAPFSAEAVAKYFAGDDPAYPSTDWYSVVFRDWAPQQNNNIAIRGGTEKLKYMGFFGYQDQETMIKTNGGNYSRYNLQSNVDAVITDGLTLSVDLMATYDKGKFPGRGIGQGDGIVWQDLYATRPWYPASLPDPEKLSYGGADVGSVALSSNMDVWGYQQNKGRDIRTTATLAYDIPFIEGLQAKAMVNYSDWQTYAKRFQKPYQFYTYNAAADLYTLAGGMWTTAELNESIVFNGQLTQQYSLNYNRLFNGVHQITALAVLETIEYSSNNFSAFRRNFLTSAIDQLFVGGEIGKDNSGSASEMGRNSVIGRINYSYKDKYLLETILRADASANFPSENRWGYFPSVSVGWALSKENFMAHAHAVDLLKVRAGYGSSGYDYQGNFQYLSGYQISGIYQWGNEFVSGLSPTIMANPFMTWEKMDIYNAGVDFAFMNRMIYGAVDGFYRKRSGILATRAKSVPGTFGASVPLENINSSNDRGFELTIGTAKSTGDFRFDINANISWSRAKWNHFDEAAYDDPDQKRLNQASGQWTDRMVGYVSDGLFTGQAEIDALAYSYAELGGNNETLRPGDVKYKDTNGDGVLNWRDQQEIGKGNTPHWFYGLSSIFTYKQFDLTAMFQGAAGYSTSVGGYTTETTYNLRWTEENNNANALVPRLGGSSSNGWASDYRLRSTFYLRLKNTALGYTIPSELLEKVGIEKLRVYASATNLLTLNSLEKYHIDPEAPSGSATMYYPQQRTISFGVNLSF